VSTGWLRELYERRDLLLMITWREVKVKYKQSVMGLLWAVLMPMVIVGAGVIVRFAFAAASGTEVVTADIARVTVKAAPWAFFVAALRFGMTSLVSNSTLVTKIWMPREIFPIAAVLSQLIDLGVAAIVVTAALVFAGVGTSWYLLWVPPILLVLTALCLAGAIATAAAALFFRDVKYIVEVILTFAIFFTPVFYDAALFGPWEAALMLNPVAPLLEGLGAVVVDHRAPDLGWLAYSAVWGVGGLSFATALFKRLEPLFAEAV
jgi:homopolymeric O-antigen transport system permease protein